MIAYLYHTFLIDTVELYVRNYLWTLRLEHHRCNPDDCDAASFSPFGMKLESCVTGMIVKRRVCMTFSLFYYKLIITLASDKCRTNFYKLFKIKKKSIESIIGSVV